MLYISNFKKCVLQAFLTKSNISGVVMRTVCTVVPDVCHNPPLKYTLTLKYIPGVKNDIIPSIIALSKES
ncbi:hypothetical protein METP3_02215 [Methanosarcinales archaeon]|nr:hypothetical protein METP3_02215 [Methanosarcinales archaeon]